jgi:AbrB family looped-hinge helix DNA binding protein
MRTTLSSKFQLVIPKAVREELNLVAGQQFSVVAKGRVIELVPLRPAADARGMLKGVDPENYRDRSDRY